MAESDSEPRAMDTPIVGVGASAGGVKALSAFFEGIPADIGASFVVIVHLDPTAITCCRPSANRPSAAGFYAAMQAAALSRRATRRTRISSVSMKVAT
jgi:hypothetical protein